MEINRTINGVNYKFQLTPDELADAFYEQRDNFDIEDIVEYGEMFDSSEIEKMFGCTYNKFLSLKEDMAAEMRRNMDKYDMSFPDAREEAIREIIRKNKENVS